MKVGLLVMVSVVVASAGFAYAQSDDGSADTIPSEVVVGSLLPLTGGYSSVGVQVDAATALAIDDFNDYLMNSGAEWRFLLLREDSATNPVMALEKMQSLHSRGADIVFGPAGSSQVSSVKNYADTNNMISLSCCSTSPALSVQDDRIFRIVADDFNQGLAFGKLLEHNGIEAIVPLWIGDTYGDGLRDAAVDDFVSRGGTYDEGIRYNPDTVEFSVTVGELASTVQDMVDIHGADKVGVVVVAFDEIVPILQSANSYDVLKQVAWFGSESIAQSTAIVDDPLALRFTEEAGFTAVQLLLSTGQKAQQVNDGLSSQLGDSPNAFVYTAYDAVWLVGMSIIETGSADPTDIVAVLPDIAAGYTEGALSSTKLNDNGDLATANYEIWKVADGGWNKQAVFYIEEDTIMPVSDDGADDDTTMADSGDDAMMVDGTEFAPDYTITGGAVTGMYTAPSVNTLVIALDADDAGMLEITLPRELIDSQSNDGADSQFFVMTNGEEAHYDETGTDTDSRTISVQFDVDTENIEIVGSAVAVPEFGVVALSVLAVSIVAVIVLASRSNIGIVVKH